MGEHSSVFSRPHLLLATTKKAGTMQTSLRINGTLQRTLTNSKLWVPPLKNYFSVLLFYLSMPDGLFILIICNVKTGSSLCKPGWPGICYVDRPSLPQTCNNLPASASYVGEL